MIYKCFTVGFHSGLVWHNQGFEITIILWRGKSLEPVQSCRSFGPSTSHPLLESWLLGCRRKIERAHPLSKGRQEEHRSLRANGNVNVGFRQLWKDHRPVQCSHKRLCTVRCLDFAPEIQGRKRKLQMFLLQRGLCRLAPKPIIVSVIFYCISNWVYCSQSTSDIRVSDWFAAADFGNTGGGTLK